MMSDTATPPATSSFDNTTYSFISARDATEAAAWYNTIDVKARMMSVHIVDVGNERFGFGRHGMVMVAHCVARTCSYNVHITYEL